MRTCLAKDPEERCRAPRTSSGSCDGSRKAPPQGWPRRRPASRRELATLGHSASRRSSPQESPSGRAVRRPPPGADAPLHRPAPAHRADRLAGDLAGTAERLAFGGNCRGKSMLRVRDLGSDEVQTLAGTETGEALLVPHSGFSAFYSRGKLGASSSRPAPRGPLRRGARSGGRLGSRATSSSTPESVGRSIALAASGGTPTRPRARSRETSCTAGRPCSPTAALPLLGEDHKVETRGSISSLDAPERKLLLRNGAAGQFLPPGHGHVRPRRDAPGATLRPGPRQPRGDSEPVTRPVMRRTSLSTGTSSRVPHRNRGLSAVNRDRGSCGWTGGHTLKAVGPRVIMNVSLSFDNHAAAFTLRQSETVLQTIWTLDLERDVATPFVESGWMPSGPPTAEALLSLPKGPYECAGSSCGPRVETCLGFLREPYDVSADGARVLDLHQNQAARLGVVASTALTRLRPCSARSTRSATPPSRQRSLVRLQLVGAGPVRDLRRRLPITTKSGGLQWRRHPACGAATGRKSSTSG